MTDNDLIDREKTDSEQLRLVQNHSKKKLTSRKTVHLLKTRPMDREPSKGIANENFREP